MSSAEKAARRRSSPTRGVKDTGEELDQVAGNAEDEVGERVAAMRESELLFGDHSLLATFGPMLVHICGTPKNFKACLTDWDILYGLTLLRIELYEL